MLAGKRSLKLLLDYYSCISEVALYEETVQVIVHAQFGFAMCTLLDVEIFGNI